MGRPTAAAGWFLLVALMAGCGTTRFTDTHRSATEMLLISKAVDETLANVDFRPLAGKTVYLEEKYLEGIQDRGYLISSLRQHLLASGALLQEERKTATYIVEPRAGAVATDRNSLLIGIPQTILPTFAASPVPLPSQIPEIALAKSTEQRAYAKIAVFAYNRLTGRPVMQSGVAKAHSNSKDLWLFGLGPFQGGNVRDKTEFNGNPVSIPFFGESEQEDLAAQVAVTQPASWTETASTANRDVRPPEPKPTAPATAAAPPPAQPPSGFAADRGAPPADLPPPLQPPVLPASFLPGK